MKRDLFDSIPHKFYALAVMVSAFLLAGCAPARTEVIPMQQEIFVQGAEYYQDQLLLSSGLYGKSYVGVLQDGAMSSQTPLPPEYFAEGLTVFQDKVYVLTWQEHTALVYTLSDGALVPTGERFRYPMEGWGLTHDATHLILSDGSDQIYFLNPSTFEVVRSIHVTEKGAPVTRLNELEFASGAIYANVWLTARIVKIDPVSGEVLQSYDFSEYAGRDVNQGSADDVLNGIAHESGTTFRIFGKNWGESYRLEME